MKKTISIILIAAFAAVLGTSTYFIVRHNKEADKQAELYHNLASVVEAQRRRVPKRKPPSRSRIPRKRRCCRSLPSCSDRTAIW